MADVTRWHRPMAEMVEDIFDGIQKASTARLRVRASSLEMDLPVEVRLADAGGEAEVLAGLPVWRWRTDFDLEPARLRMVWQEEWK